MTVCPFCGPERTLFENELAFVVASDPCLCYGHLLVIPKRHVVKPWEMSDAEMLAVWSLIKKFQKILAERVGQGCDVREHYRPFLPENKLKVNHVHFHLIPRTKYDEIYLKTQMSEKSVFRKLSNVELDKLKML